MGKKGIIEQAQERMSSENLRTSFDNYLIESAGDEVKELVKHLKQWKGSDEDLLFDILKAASKIPEILATSDRKISQKQAILAGLFIALDEDRDNLPPEIRLLMSFVNADWQSIYFGRLYADGNDELALELIKEAHPDDAEHFVSIAAMSSMTVIRNRVAGRKDRKSQSLKTIIAKLAHEPGTAEELWPKLYGEMDNADFDIEDQNSLIYAYTDPDTGKPGKISKKTFMNDLSKERKKSR